MEKCLNCAGEGIVGAGDVPTAKQGPLTTCTMCAGTGKVGELSEVSSENSMEETETVVEETAPEEVVETPTEETASETTSE